MLCLADRYFYSSELWSKAATTGAKLVWRVRKNMRLECLERFADGSYRSAAYTSETDWRHKTNGTPCAWSIISSKAFQTPSPCTAS